MSVLTNHHRQVGSIATLSGRSVDLLNPDPLSFEIQDIVNALARVCRFAGHIGIAGVETSTVYSVAEHSVLLTYWCEDQGLSRRVQRAALMHDAAEAYLGDMPTPLKAVLPDYRKIEARFETALRERFDYVDKNDIPVLVEADMAIQTDEIQALRPDWGADLPDPLGIDIRGWYPNTAHRRFLMEAKRLGIS